MPCVRGRTHATLPVRPIRRYHRHASRIQNRLSVRWPVFTRPLLAGFARPATFRRQFQCLPTAGVEITGRSPHVHSHTALRFLRQYLRSSGHLLWSRSDTAVCLPDPPRPTSTKRRLVCSVLKLGVDRRARCMRDSGTYRAIRPIARLPITNDDTDSLLIWGSTFGARPGP